MPSLKSKLKNVEFITLFERTVLSLVFVIFIKYYTIGVPPLSKGGFQVKEISSLA
jgi:hypothetical protein